MGNQKNKRRAIKRSYSMKQKHMMEVVKQRARAASAATSPAAEVSSTGVQFAEVPPAIELGTDGPDVIEPASEIAQVVEESKPLPKLRRRRPPPMTSPMSTRSNIRVTEGDKEQLAGLVRGHPVLYNTHYAHFRDKAQRRYAWQDISTRMLRPDSECIAIWKLLKSNYSQALRIRKRKMEQGLNVRSSKYENFMSFVKPFLKVCKSAPPTTTAAAWAPCPGCAPAPACSAASPARSGYVPALPAQPPRNTIVELFRNLGETVKDFPKDVKVRVQSEVLKVVSDAREFILRNNTEDQVFVVEDIVIKEEPLELQ